MRRNFKHLFDDKKIFGFYSDEVFVSVIAGFVVAVPFYVIFYGSGGVFDRFGGFLFLLVVAVVAATVLSTMKLVRGNNTKVFYARVLGRNEKAKTFKGMVTKAVLYLMAVDKIFGKNRITKTQNYSP